MLDSLGIPYGNPGENFEAISEKESFKQFLRGSLKKFVIESLKNFLIKSLEDYLESFWVLLGIHLQRFRKEFLKKFLEVFLDKSKFLKGLLILPKGVRDPWENL